MGVEYRKIYKWILLIIVLVNIATIGAYSNVVGGGVISQIQVSEGDLQPINPFQEHHVIFFALVGLFFIQRLFRLDTSITLNRFQKISEFEIYYLKKLMALSAVYIIGIVLTNFFLFWLLQQMPFRIRTGPSYLDEVVLNPFSAYTYIIVMLINACILNLLFVTTSFWHAGEKIRTICVILICGCQAMAYYSPSLSRVFVFAFAGYAGFDIEDFPWLILKYLCWFLLAWVWRFKKREDYA